MATEKEGTLQIKSFGGISRFYSSPNNPPNKLYTIQDMYAPNRGQLSYPKGTVYAQGFPTLLSAFNLGVPMFTDYIRTQTNDDNVLFFTQLNDAAVGYSTTYAAPVISNFTFTTNGANVASVTYKVSYVGMGGETALSSGTATVTVGSNGIHIAFTTPPDWVCSINVYSFNTNTSYSLCGCIIRNANGTWPTTVDFVSSHGKITESAAGQPVDDPSAVSFSGQATASGTLTPGKTYYFAYAPFARLDFVGVGDPLTYVPKVAQNVSGTVFAYTLPQGCNAISVNFTVSGKYDGVNSYSDFVVFMGITPEDLLLASTADIGFNDPGRVPQPIPLSGGGTTAHCLVGMIPQETNAGFVIRSDSTGRRGYYNLTSFGQPGASMVGPCTGLFATTSNTLTQSTRQILPVRGETIFGNGAPFYRAFYLLNYIGAFGGVALPANNRYQSAYLNGRLFYVNGVDCPFYTNGYTLKPVNVDYQTAPPPATQSVAFFKNVLIYTGGPQSDYNTEGLVYYTALTSSGDSNPFSFTTTPSATPVRNFVTARTPSGGRIVAAAVNAVAQSVDGPSAVLIIGCENSIFTTTSLASGLAESSVGIGFAGIDCHTNTNAGSFFIGSDYNLYLLTDAGIAVPRGLDVQNIIPATDQTTVGPCRPMMVFHNNHLKLAYSSNGGATVYDRELWCDVQLDEDHNPMMIWTGPHKMNPFFSEVIVPTRGTHRDERFQSNTTVFTRTDADLSTSYLGADVTRTLVFNQLTLSADHFMKILTRLYLAAASSIDVTMTITFSMTDVSSYGTGTGGEAPVAYTDSITIQGGAGDYVLAQKIFATRYRGRIIKDFTLTWSAGASEETLLLYDVSILFDVQKRRLL